MTPDGAPGRDALDCARPLHIALLGYRSQPHGGGQGIYLHYLSKALVEAGHRVDVLSGPPYPELDPRVRLVHIPSLDLFVHGLGSLRPRHLLSYSDMVEWLSKLTGGFAEPYTFGRRVRRHLQQKGRHHYDLIHDNQSLSYGVLALQEAGFPVVTTVHHPVTLDLQLALDAAGSARARLLIRRWHSFLHMQRRVVRRLRHVITVSERSRRDIEREFGVPRGTVDLIYNGIDTAVFRPHGEIARRPLRLMATASADAPLKGLGFLLEAYAGLLTRYPGLELLVVGRPRTGGATAQLLTRLGIEDRVKFVAGISTGELVRLYAEATIAVVPSLYEGFGLPAGEAMACAVPLVSTDGGALPEVVGDAGVLVPAGDTAALTGAIADLLDDPERRERLGRAGRERILERFSWSVCARELLAYYREVIAHADR
jgi:glycosyltransferase involved in cell wall biosynthesis